MSNRIKKLEALERLWLSTESAGEKENAMVAMRTLARRIAEEEDPSFNLSEWLARDEGNDDADAEPDSPNEWFEVVVASGAGWAGRLIELLAEQRAGGVTVRKTGGRSRGKRGGWVYEIRGEAARETYEHFCEYRDKLFESNAYYEGEDEALNWAFEIIDLVKSETVG